jgi:hypothetical protein
MSTQLRLVETQPTPSPTRAKASANPRRARATTSRSATGKGRRVHWDADWRLSASRRRIGLQGIAAARAALAQAHRPPDLRPAEQLSEAS